MNKFWNFAEKDGTRVLELRGTIAEETWYGDEATPKQFHDELIAGTGDIDVYINSPGGDCFAASQIYTMLKEYPFKVTVKIDGLAASAASVISMAGDEVLMASTAMMMIHNPATFAFGDHGDMEKTIEMLDEVKEAIINAYEIKTGLARDVISEMMDQETWMNANKAVDMKFADGFIGNDIDNTNAAYAYSVKKCENAIYNKIIEKAEKAEDEQNGRSVFLLQENLKVLEKFI